MDIKPTSGAIQASDADAIIVNLFGLRLLIEFVRGWA